MSARSAFITGLGRYLPSREILNTDLPESLEASPEWIVQRTGIRARRYAEIGQRTSDLATEAARAALASSGTALADVDCLIAATLSPDHMFPGIGCYAQRKLGIAGIPAYDIRAQCSGFLYSLNAARAFITAGVYRRILITCAEIQSRALGTTKPHRHVTPLFADGAGAAVVTDAPDGPGRSLSVDYVRVYADGSGADSLRTRMWDAAVHPWLDWRQFAENEGDAIHPEMDGKFVFRHAVTGMTAAAREASSASGVALKDVALFIAHQANININLSVATALRIPEDRFPSNIDRYGNTTAASIPILLSEVLESGRVAPGDRLMLLAFGAGFTWGAAVLTAI